jgi:hypothetical protein
MCCDTMACGAQSEEVGVAFDAFAHRPVAHRHDVARRAQDAVCRAAGASLTSLQLRHPSYQTVNPVRQCARRWVVDSGVAQAAPLFSDHAPREVHLWQ